MKIIDTKIKMKWFLLLVFWLSIFIVLPFKASADFQDRCWLKAACEGANGIWGKGSEYKKKFENRYPNLDSLSAKCDNIGASETALCFLSDPAVVLQVGIPGVSEKFCNNYVLGEEPKTCNTDKDCSNGGKCRPGIRNGFAGYLKGFFNFFIPAIAVMSVVMIMWGGFKRIAAAGSTETIKGANDTILGAVSGLVLALISYSLLNLINPALVANSTPPIEKVKPDYFGFCPMYKNNETLYESGWVRFTCGGNDSNPTCLYDDDCSNGLKCSTSSNLLQKDPSETCGDKLKIDGRECLGQECRDSDKGCYGHDGVNGKKKYGCAPYIMKGRISGVEVNYLDAVLICNDGSSYDCNLQTPGQEASSSSDYLDVEKKGSYALNGCWRGTTQVGPEYCNNRGGFKGLLLGVERESDGCDDWYGIDASSCGTSTKKLKDTDGDFDIWTYSLYPACVRTFGGEVNYDKIDKAKLFQPWDNNGNKVPISCDLLIISNEFPDQ